MKRILLAMVGFGALNAGAQTTNFDQMQHIQTALNHLTVIDAGEPVVDLAIADKDAFQVERHDNKVFLMPLRESVATNLFIWTSTRQLDYEIDPAGDLTKMNVLVRNLPQQATHLASSEPSDQEIQKIASMVLTETLIGTEAITHDEKAPASVDIHVELNQVFRSKDRLFIRYTITNSSASPFRITPPDVYQAAPTQVPVSLLSLRNHQLSDQTYAEFRAKQGSSLPLASSQSLMNDLAPGQTTTGILSIRRSEANPPQLYRLEFGLNQSKAIAVAAVL